MGSVAKNDQGNIQSMSQVYQLRELTGANLFPVNHIQNVCFLCVDPIKRQATILYHAASAYYQ
jgi:hypothetical protein